MSGSKLNGKDLFRPHQPDKLEPVYINHTSWFPCLNSNLIVVRIGKRAVTSFRQGGKMKRLLLAVAASLGIGVSGSAARALPIDFHLYR